MPSQTPTPTPREIELAGHVLNLADELGGVAGLSWNGCDNILAALKAIRGLVDERRRLHALAWIDWDREWEFEHKEEIDHA